MKNRILKAIALFLTSMMILGFANVLPTYATDGALVLVDPTNNIFPPPYLGVGDTFTVSVAIANMTNIGGFEFKLYWDPALLEGVDMTENLFKTVTPPGETGNIWQLSHEVAADHVWYAYTYKNLTRAKDLGYAPINITLAEGYPEGKLAAAIITLKVKKVPTMAEGFVDCVLNITVSKPGDIAGKPIPHTVINGYYRLNWSPPTIKPFFSVDPPSFEATALGQVFNISIKINNLDAGWEAVGFEFKLKFNNTLLQVLNVYEGPWLKPFGASPNQGTLPMHVIGTNYVLFGDLVLPDAHGVWHAPFPSDSGVLAIIEFNATLQGMFPEVLSCVLDLYDTKIGNWLAQPVPQNPPVDGSYSIRPKVLGRMIDIFTQYPDPYGGQGIGKPSDMFWPQKEVILYAKVTYNEWPEQNKDVAFQIIDPHGDTYTVIYARTNATGIAEAFFRLPWPCDDPEYYFGEWTVIGTVDVACTIVNDTLTFKYDYLVRIVKVTTDKTKYAHCEYMNITVEFKSYAMQHYDVILSVTVLDETGVPFGFIYVETSVGGAQYCSYKNFRETVSIHVVKWARAGQAKIIVGVLNDWPANGGTVVSGPFTPVPVDILAEWA
ncbi:MAG: cohesin domain-containing protein [Candidatus Bathyarchaeia archaeon]